MCSGDTLRAMCDFEDIRSQTPPEVLYRCPTLLLRMEGKARSNRGFDMKHKVRPDPPSSYAEALAPSVPDQGGAPTAGGGGVRVAGGTLIYVVLILVGVGLAIFGVIRLTAEDPEVERLSNELASLQEQRDDLVAQLATTEARGAEVSAAAEGLDDSLEDLVATYEAFVENHQTVVDDWNAIVNEVADADLSGAVEDEVLPDIEEAASLRGALQEAFDQAQVALTRMRDVLESGGE
jgi:hypothetical protein